METDPPPSRLFDKLGPVLAACRAPASISRHQHLHITPNSSTVNPEGFGQSLLIRGLVLPRSDQFHQFQAAFVGESSAFSVVPVAAGHKEQHLLLTYEVYPPAAFTFHVLRITFSPALTQVLALANKGCASTEILSIGNSIDKSNDMSIIVCTGMKGIDGRVGYKRLNDQHPMTRPDTSSNLVISILTSGCSEVRLSRFPWTEEIVGSNPATHIYGNVAELGIRYRLRPGCSKGHMWVRFPPFLSLLETWKGHEAPAGWQGNLDMDRSEVLEQREIVKTHVRALGLELVDPISAVQAIRKEQSAVIDWHVASDALDEMHRDLEVTIAGRRGGLLLYRGNGQREQK